MGTHSSLVSGLSRTMCELLGEELYASAEIVGSMLLGAAEACDAMGAETSPMAKALELYGDSLNGLGEFRRAQAYYRKAAQRNRMESSTVLLPEQPHEVESLESSLESSSSKRLYRSSSIKLREARCSMRLGDVGAAINAFEAAEGKTARDYVDLGKLYLEQAMKKPAISAFESALKQNHCAVEVIEPLAQLYGAPHDALAKLLSETFFHSSMKKKKIQQHHSQHSQHREALGEWLETFARGHAALAAHEFRAAISHFEAIDRLLGSSSNLHGLLRMGKAFFGLGEIVNARYAFHKARIYDRHNVAFMDLAAKVLPTHAERSTLAHDLMAVGGGGACSSRPEPWLVVAIVTANANNDDDADLDKALQFVDKAVSCDARHAASYLFRGELLVRLGKADKAIVAYFKANSLVKDLPSYTGLVEAYLLLRKFKEALHAAKDAVAALPTQPRAVALLGKVVATSPDGAEKAKRAFTKALALDCACLDAILPLVDVYLKEKKNYPTCLDLLHRALQQQQELQIITTTTPPKKKAANQHHDDDNQRKKKEDASLLHAKVASVYVASNQYADALASYHRALSLNPDSQEAQRGLQALEQLMYVHLLLLLESNTGNNNNNKAGIRRLRRRRPPPACPRTTTTTSPSPPPPSSGEVVVVEGRRPRRTSKDHDLFEPLRWSVFPSFQRRFQQSEFIETSRCGRHPWWHRWW